jgi:hypothetical protein
MVDVQPTRKLLSRKCTIYAVDAVKKGARSQDANILTCDIKLNILCVDKVYVRS